MTRPINRGRPRPGPLVRDGLLTARAQPAATATSALVVAMVCLVVLLTTGRSVAAEQDVVASIDAVGTRLVTVTDTTGRAGIASSSVEAIAALRGVTWAFGLGPATAAHNSVIGRTGPGVPMRAFVGPLPTELSVTEGRAGRAPGEAVAGVRALRGLGMDRVVGGVDDDLHRAALVGAVRADGPLDFLQDLVLRSAQPDEDVPLRFVYVELDDAAQSVALARDITAVIDADDPGAVKVETSAGAIALRDVVAGRLGTASRQLMAGVLGVGLVLVTVTMLGAVSARRRDFGRRRALGASRSAVVVLVLTQSAAAAVCGVLVGMAAGLVVLGVGSSPLPDAGFVVGVG
ncbi:MAG: FtsX-like permease family protein, partial [Brevundimonas sp.]